MGDAARTIDGVRLAELRHASLEAWKRRTDLQRWAASDESCSPYAKGLREGLSLACAFVQTGRFGPAGVCVHLARTSADCAACAADAARAPGDELGLLELEQQWREIRLADLARWQRAYAASDDDASRGIAAGLLLAREYMSTGELRSEVFLERPKVLR